MKTLDSFLRSLPITRGLAHLSGIPNTRLDDFREALRSPRAIPVLLLLITLRLRRGLGKLASQAKGSAWRRVNHSTESAASTEREEHVESRLREGNSGCTGYNLRLPPMADDEAFPKIIFQTWKSKHSLPHNYAHWSATIKNLNPSFDHYLWDDQDNRCFIAQFYPWFLPVYDDYPREIYRVDAVRYFFLYQFGGLYVDMDTECLRPLTLLPSSGDVWLGRMGNDADFPHSVPNAIMASRPLQEFWLLVIYLLIQKADAVGDPIEMASHGPEALTGPVLLKQALNIYQSTDRDKVSEMIAVVGAHLPAGIQPRHGSSQVIVLQPGQWYPIDWTNLLHLHLASEVVAHNVVPSACIMRWLFPESCLVTYWTHSWKPSSSK